MRALLIVIAVAAAPPPKPTAAGVKAWVKQVSAELFKASVAASTGDWIHENFITDDTDRNASLLDDALLQQQDADARIARTLRGVKVDTDTKRMIYLLTIQGVLAAPKDGAKREELSDVATKMVGVYGKHKWCGIGGKAPCRDLEALEDVMAKSRKWDELLDAWAGWSTVGRDVRPLYQRFVALADQGARDNGYKDLGERWRDQYEMSPADLAKETDRLWKQVEPLYRDLHCKVQRDLARAYGADKVPPGKPIPAHILGNMWAQDWSNVYSLVEPYPGQPSMDVDAALKAQGWNEERMVKTGEAFYTSLGLDPLPKTFWERSLFKKPPDREVVCHASAWDVTFSNDLRIKMCIRINQEDLEVIHHELGHNYYQHYYNNQPFLYQDGAHDGFHEAIGDSLVLSMTPGYYKQLGLIKQEPADPKGEIDVQMRRALREVAFLPFAIVMDRWRWDVFAGKIPDSKLNEGWWQLRRDIQGVAPPVARGEDEFDPGAKYHIPADTPYLRYFFAAILKFQFYRAMCQAAGWKGPLNQCNFYGSKAAGERLRAMLALGRSKPWPEALEAMTGSKQMDGSALLEYFAPLQKYLKEQNAGQQCGW